MRLAPCGGYTASILTAAAGYRGLPCWTTPSRSMTATQDELATAQDAGRLAAEAFDRALREAEQREREELLARLAGRNDGSLEAFGAPGATYSDSRLQQDIARLATFHQAVLSSRAWRVVQWARRPFGRAW